MKIATVGDNCIDAYEKERQYFPGGNPVNVAVYAKRMGAQSAYVGVVGDDDNGEVMRRSLEGKGVDISHLRVLPGKTAVTQVELVDGDRVFGDYDEGVLADLKLSQEDIDFLGSYDMVVSGLWGKVERDMGKIKAKGVPVAFDFATKLDDPVIERAIYDVDYAFFAYDEDDMDFIRTYMKTMQAKGPKYVVVTLGEKGSIAYDGQRYYEYGIVPCEVVDTMGAGDSYIAAFLCGILQGKPIEECMAMGAQNSSITIAYNGAW